MNNYECFVKVPLGTGQLTTKVRVLAQNVNAAKGQLVATYGTSNVIGMPTQVRV
jgi:hypothetical protein